MGAQPALHCAAQLVPGADPAALRRPACLGEVAGEGRWCSFGGIREGTQMPHGYGGLGRAVAAVVACFACAAAFANKDGHACMPRRMQMHARERRRLGARQALTGCGSRSGRCRYALCHVAYGSEAAAVHAAGTHSQEVASCRSSSGGGAVTYAAGSIDVDPCGRTRPGKADHHGSRVVVSVLN